MNRPEGAPLYAENRVSRIICYVIITVFVLRKLLFLWDEPSILLAVSIIAVYLALYIALPFYASRWPQYYPSQFCYCNSA